MPIAARRVLDDRGATVVEYALGIALFAVVLLGGIQVLQDSSSERLSERGASIGYPDEVPPVLPPGGGPGGPGGTTGGDEGGLWPGNMSGSCTGASNDRRDCSFTLDPEPETVVWSIEPASGFTGVLPSVRFDAPGDYSVRATIDGQFIQRIVRCVRHSNVHTDCSLL